MICGQLANKNFHEPPSFTNLKRSDAAICLYHILTMLISYREHYSKNEQDEMVKMFVTGIGSWERTNEICIHALSICCHELPGSLSKTLETALTKMSQIITQANIAVHILEFLSGLARLPELFKNFREDEFKIVFGICFRFLQDARESRSKTLDRNSARSGTTPGRSSAVIGSTLADDLPQYVYALAYHVMAFWFMSLKIQDRPKQIPWITKSLAYTGPEGRLVLDEQAQVTIDMMHRISFSDRDETQYNAAFAEERDGLQTATSWLVGRSILTIETAGRTGLSQMTRRRPTGTTYTVVSPNVVNPPPHQAPITIGLAAEAFHTPDYVGILPEHVFQEFYAPLDLAMDLVAELPNEDAAQRALTSFDRISPLDGHKVGILYVGQAQTKEQEVLSNVMGSADYTSFVHRIGTLCELRDATFNTQGLDRSDRESDGKFTFAWRDRVTELVFHVTTMMPNVGDDFSGNNKKRHIGNDYVNIIFNNSGYSWTIDNIPSDFNMINIVITPEARASFVEVRTKSSAYADTVLPRPTSESKHWSTPNDPNASTYYKVTVLTKPDLPALSPAHSTKIISGASLPAFVRLLALNASFFASVWANRGSDGSTGAHVSSWRSRLNEINKLYERYGTITRPAEAAPETPKSASAGFEAPRSSVGSGTLGSNDHARVSTSSSTSAVGGGGESVVFRRQSKPNIFGGDGAGNRNSGFTDIERTSSAGSHRT